MVAQQAAHAATNGVQPSAPTAAVPQPIPGSVSAHGGSRADSPLSPGNDSHSASPVGAHKSGSYVAVPGGGGSKLSMLGGQLFASLLA